MSRARLLLPFITALVVAGPAAAMQISNAQPFALVQSGTVTWQTNVTMDVASMTVRSKDIVFDALVYNFTPASGSLALTVTHWTQDKKQWNISSPAANPFEFRWTNPGNDYTLSRNGTIITTCWASNATCYWNVTSNSRHMLKLTAPGVDGIGNSSGTAPTPEPAPASGGGGGGFSGITDLPLVQDGRLILPPLPRPVDVFPQMNGFQWLAVLVGFVLLMNGFAPTRAFLPALFQVPAPPVASQLSGSVVLVLVYFS